MKKRDAICQNEQYKTISRTLWQLATALIAAAVIKTYNARAITPETAGWFFTAAVLMWLGWKVLDLPDSEDM